MATARWDVLVVGAGLAGLLAAVEAARQGRTVGVLSRTEPFHTNSRHPRSVNLTVASDDDWRKQVEDLWNDSHFLADWDTMVTVAREGTELVLREFGDLLDRDENGQIVAQGYAGTSRNVSAGDYTGLNFMRKLYGELTERGVQLLTPRAITSLVTDEGRCVGVTALNLLTGDVEGHGARSVILCTGGYGYVYQNSSHGPDSAGDGHALAYQAGAMLKDVEFVYFHTTLAYGTSFIITEGAIEHGMRVWNRHNELFFDATAPRQDASVRYYTRRNMALEIERGGGVEDKYLWGDFTHLSEAEINEKYPRSRRALMDIVGLDIARDRVPIVPGVQVTLGGIQIDLDGKTTVPGLLAAGECASPGLNGADWRVGNPVLAALVFGSRAGRTAAMEAGSGAMNRADSVLDRAVDPEVRRLGEIAARSDGVPFELLRGELRRAMSENASVVRDAEKLDAVRETVDRVELGYGDARISHRGTQFNEQLVEFMGLGSMVLMARLLVTAAEARRETRGSHWRRDYPDRDDARWLVHSSQMLASDGPRLDHVPVQLGELRPNEKVLIR